MVVSDGCKTFPLGDFGGGSLVTGDVGLVGGLRELFPKGDVSVVFVTEVGWGSFPKGDMGVVEEQ